MGTWLNHPWVAWTIAGLMLAYGGFLGAWALFRDRSRGRRRCPKCWYDLRGTPEMRCSECGYKAKREQQLFATRRRWRLALLGVLVMLGGTGAGLSPKVRRDGWLSLVPTDVLIRFVPPAYEDPWDFPSGANPNPAACELRRRLYRGHRLAGRHWKYLLENKSVIRTRRRWPANVPLAVTLSIPPFTAAQSIEVRARLANAEPARFELRQFSGPPVPREWVSDRPARVGFVVPGSREAVFDCTVCGRPQRFGESEVLWEGVVRLPMEATLSAREAMVPVDDADVTRAVREALRVRLWNFGAPTLGWLPENAEPLCRFNVELEKPLERAPLDGAAIALRLELLHDGKIVGQTVADPRDVRRPQPFPDLDRPTILLTHEDYAALVAWWWPRATTRFSPPPVGPTDALAPPPWLPTTRPEPAARWHLRVRGDGEAALTEWDRDKYWAGEFTIPLEETLK